MASPDKTALLAELHLRLDRLACLTRSTKQRVIETFTGDTFPSDVLSKYLDYKLNFVEQFIAPVEHPEFLSLCQQLAGLKETREVLRALGLQTPLDEEDNWLWHAMRLELNKLSCLFALANHHAAIDPLEGDLFTNSFLLLADALTFVNRHFDGVRLMQRLLQVGRADFESINFADRLEDRLRETEANTASSCVVVLGSALPFVNRLGDSLQLFEAYLHLSQADYVSATSLANRLSKQLKLHRNTAANLVSSFAIVLRLAGRWDDSTHLLEAHIRLTHADYEAQNFEHTLKKRLRGINASIAIKFVTQLAFGLTLVDRPSDGRRLLQAQLRLEDATYEARSGLNLRDSSGRCRRRADLSQRLARCRRRLRPNAFCDIVEILAGALWAENRRCHAVTLLETYCDLDEDAYRRTEILEDRLGKCFRELTSDSSANCVKALARGLVGTERLHDARQLLDVFCGDFAWLDMAAAGPVPETSVELLSDWLVICTPKHQRREADFCRKIIPYLRRALHRPKTTPADRKRFAQRLANLRQMIIELLTYWAGREMDPEKAAELHLDAIRIDVELGQRALFEQFVAGEYVLVAGDDGAGLPRAQWPFTESSLNWQRFREGHFDPRSNALAFAAFDAVDDRSPHALREVSGAREMPKPADRDPSAGPLSSRGARGLHRESPPWLEAAERLVAEGIDDARLASVLGRDTVFLRSTFDSDGTLRWWALHSDGAQVAIVANNWSAPANSLDLERLRWSTARHDLEVDCIYQLAKDEWPAEWLGYLCSRAADVAEALQESDFLDRLSEYLAKCLAPFHPSVMLGFVPLLTVPTDTAARKAWRQRALVEWSPVTEFFAQLQREGAPYGRVLQLDESTRRYLSEVSQVWNLEPLADWVRNESRDLDLVVQMDDVLHAVPVPHLVVGGRPLFEQVRSCRVSLSVLLDTLQQRLEVAAQERDPDNRRLLAVSWFEPGDPADEANNPGDPAGVGGVLLHDLHQQTAAEFGLEYLAAAEDPAAFHGTLLAALGSEEERVGYRIATFLGHGSTSQSGVHFADALWNGQGRPLDGVEFPIIPSCSIGRVQHTGERDVEGFCVTLALHQARAALACRWKVNAVEAPYFADEVARQYLRLRETESPETSGACLRARAVNLARKQLLANNTRSGHTHVGLNTAAAFELYGRG